MTAAFQPQRRSQIFVLGACLGLAFCARAWGFTFDVTPTVIQVTVPAGGSSAGKISIKNVGTEDLQLSGRVMDWKYAGQEGEKKFFPIGALPYSCSRWVSFSPPTLALKPGETKEVSFSLAVPKNAQGGYYSTIIFRGMGKVQPQGGVTVNLAIEMGSLILVEIDKTQNLKGVIKDFTVNTPQGRPLEVKVRFKNEGNVRVEAKGRLSILDKDGNAIGWTRFPPVKTLPGDEWTTSTTWPGQLKPGHYRLVSTFELAPGQVLVNEKEIDFK